LVAARPASITGIYFKRACKKSPRRAVSCPMSQATAEELAGFRQQLLSFAIRRLRNRELAEDAVQETLLAALEDDRFEGGSSLGTWLIGILKHKIVDALRTSVREMPLEDEELVLPGSDPEAGFTRRRVVDAVQARLKQLPSCAARVFVLREVMGMDTAEVCRELAISPSNCWVMNHRVRMRLRACPTIRGLAADAI
jgi:RNA polymerase sigma-70 factor, ECF subfamily